MYVRLGSEARGNKMSKYGYILDEFKVGFEEGHFKLEHRGGLWVRMGVCDKIVLTSLIIKYVKTGQPAKLWDDGDYEDTATRLYFVFDANNHTGVLIDTLELLIKFLNTSYTVYSVDIEDEKLNVK